MFVFSTNDETTVINPERNMKKMLIIIIFNFGQNIVEAATKRPTNVPTEIIGSNHLAWLVLIPLSFARS